MGDELAGTLYAGVSGFSYPSWRGGFYPSDARPADFLRLYAERLPSVELVSTGYRLPAEEQFRRWAEQVPDGFRFAVKMTGSITQGGRLDRFGTFSERVLALGDRLGPVRISLKNRRDDGLLRFLLGSLDPRARYAFELAHESWDVPEVAAAVAEAGAARVGALDGAAPFRYLRLREPPYDDAALAEAAEDVRPLLADGIDVHVYFMHEDEPRGALDAERLWQLVSA